MSNSKKVSVLVSIGVWDDQGRFLMVEEGDEHVKGLWTMPSGGLELNETLIEGAKREVLEETGCEVEITALCGVFHYQLEKIGAMSIRVCFHGKLISENKNAVLEKDVLSSSWKTREEIEGMIAAGKIRSEFAEAISKEYFAGKKYPLDVLCEI